MLKRHGSKLLLWMGSVLLLVVIALNIVFLYFPGQWHATYRVNGFIQAVDANRPTDIYPFLTPDLKGMLSKDEFVRNFAKERSYPYLTPLYVYLDDVKLAPDKLSGEANFTVAARLPGEKMNIKINYINGQYYIDAFRDIADGSYLVKFQKLKGYRL
ncbi:MAG: hypothetical protein ACYCV0_07405 [Desulfitobacteriaceae bacterium]